MAAQLLQEGAGGAVPNADADILGTSDDVLVVEAQVEHSGGVVLQPSDRLVACLHVVDNAGGVGAAGHQNVLVVLQAEDRGLVVSLESHCGGHGDGAARIGAGVRLEAGGVCGGAVCVIEQRPVLDHLGRANDQLAGFCVHVPDANGLVAGPGDDLLPVDASVSCQNVTRGFIRTLTRQTASSKYCPSDHSSRRKWPYPASISWRVPQ